MKRIPVYDKHDFAAPKYLKGIGSVDENHIPVLSVDATVEGEGLYIGSPRILARVSGCAIGCSTCDTKYSWDARGTKTVPAQLMRTEDFVDRICDAATKARVSEVSITGGEPMHYLTQMKDIIRNLRLRGLSVSMETSGVIIDHDVFRMCSSVSLDIKTPSSGVRLKSDNVARLIEVAYAIKESQLKAVVGSDDDLIFLEDHFITLLLPADPSLVRPMVLTPCADTTRHPANPDKMRDLTDMILEWNKGYNIRVIAQQHKLLNFV